MKRWKLPRVFETESARHYFQTMCELNLASKSFSQRALANFLDWPVSYLPDLIRGRKPFTVARSLEFIQAFKVDPVDAEHLIFLAISSQSKVELPALKDLRRLKSPKMREGLFPDLKVYDFNASLLFQAVNLLQPTATKEKLKHLLASRGLDADEVERSIKYGLDHKLISKEKSGYKCSFTKSYSDMDLTKSEARELQKAFLESAKSFFDDIHSPATGSSLIVTINKGRYPEVKEKIHLLKNWILEVSTVDAKAPSDETLLFQFEQHLIPIFRAEALDATRAL